MTNTENNFIENIEFKENFLPFKKDDEIKFGGEKEMQELIGFYLKNKGIENYKKNAERFKINCLLGNNGGGKSKLFEGILQYINLDFDNSFKEQRKEKVIVPKSKIDKIKGKDIILDDFFKLSGNIHYSINKDILDNSEGAFLCQAFNFLTSDDNINYIYAEFLHEKLNTNKKLYFELEINFRFLKGDIISSELEKKYINDFKWEGIDDNNFINLITSITTNTIGFGDTFITHPIKQCEYNNVLKLFNEKLFFYAFLITSGMIDTVIRLFYKEGRSHDNNLNYIEYLNLLDKGIINDDQKQLLNLIDKKDKSKGDIQEILKILYAKLKDGYSKTIKSTDILEEYDEKLIFHDKEREYLGEYFDINLKFETKNFSECSAGEKMMLIRFTNIIGEINNFLYKSHEKECLILIDEPDLHLHLDWQKQYIQKLIDVFSTLDTDIKLHFIIATHSPFIISDLPNESIVILEGEGQEFEGKKYTKIRKYEKKTFGANFVDIINDGFFFKDKILMGSFAEKNIKDFSIAQKFLMIGLEKINKDKLDKKEKSIYSFLEENDINKIEDFKKYIDLIGDDFLKENLLYL